MSSQWRWLPQTATVIIPTFNRVATLLRVLDGLAQQTVMPGQFRVIVVDDGSSDDTVARVRQTETSFALEVIQQANRGPAAARNAGLARAEGDVVVFLDDDCVPEPDWLAEHLRSHTTRGLGVIGRIVWHPEVAVTEFMRFLEDDVFSYFNISLPFDAPFACFYTGNASVDRAKAVAVGGFDESFPHAMHEDIDFAYRLRRHGVRLVFNAQARVQHLRSAELLPMLEHQRRKGRELGRFWAKHPELTDLVPAYRLGSSAWRHGFYRALFDYYLALGLQDALEGSGPDTVAETLPAHFSDVLQTVQAEERAAVEQELRSLRDEVAMLRQTATWAADLESAHHELAEAFQAQARWAHELEQQATQRGIVGRLQAGTRRAISLVRRSRVVHRQAGQLRRVLAGAAQGKRDDS